MLSQPDINLLKQYIKTLIATQIVFSDISPRRWGQEFTRLEIEHIYQSLVCVVQTADPLTNQRLIDAFDELQPMHVHWFLCEFWRELVSLIDGYPGGFSTGLSDIYSRLYLYPN